MKVIIFGKNTKKIEKMSKKLGIEVVNSNPDFVISSGGDGTFMLSENKFPGIPKILLKESKICKKCTPNLSHEEILLHIKEKKYKLEKLQKLEATALGKTISGINDIIIHNSNPRQAIRYTLKIDDLQQNEEIIGDGIVVSTIFGSSGYYKSITDSVFEIGIGLAFNNSTEQSDHIVINDKRKIKFTLLRGPAEVFADNIKDRIKIKKGDSVLIKVSKDFSSIAKPTIKN